MLQASALAIIAGYADTVGYLHFGAFAGLMTGNTILLGIDIATGQFERAAFHILIIAAFLFGGHAVPRHDALWLAIVAAAQLRRRAFGHIEFHREGLGCHPRWRLPWGRRTRPPTALAGWR